MNSRLAHIQVNVNAANLPFYSDLFDFLGWAQYVLNEGMAGYGSGAQSLWFIGGANANANDYDDAGTNHIAIGVESKADVDTVAEYLTSKGVAALFETPRNRPEFGGDGNMYYQVMFESPDKVLFEVVYTGPE